MLRAGVRGLLRAADATLEEGLRGVLHRDDDYASAGKPPCDWADPSAREQLVNALVHDANAALGVLEGRHLEGEVNDAAEVGMANRGDAELMPELLAEFAPAPSEDDHPTMRTGDPQRPPEGLDKAPAPVVYGDAAYGSGEGLAHVQALGGTAMLKVQPLHRIIQLPHLRR